MSRQTIQDVEGTTEANMQMRCAIATLGLIWLAAACSGGGGGSSPSGPTTPPTPPSTGAPQSQFNQTYGSGLTMSGSTSLTLDLYQSGEQCTAARPVVILIHGGSFQVGSKTSSPWPSIAGSLTDRGYVAISINYRLERDDPVPSAEFTPVRNGLLSDLPGPTTPAIEQQADIVASAFEDAVTAIRWAIENADANCIDTSRIALWGGSAGAVIALHTAYGLDEFAIDVPKPQVVIDYWGRFIGSGFMEASDPPLLILHGDADDVVAYSFAQELQSEAQAATVPHSFYTVTGAGHSFGAIPIGTTRVDGITLEELTLRFLDAQLQDGTENFETRTIP
ncbi:MAG: alpha/beta hydrolase [Pseudomonadota bacterium]